LYYGKNYTQKTSIILGELAAKHARTDLGFLCTKNYCLKAKKVALTEKELISGIKKGKTYKYVG
jgi:hypothetical protein